MMMHISRFVRRFLNTGGGVKEDGKGGCVFGGRVDRIVRDRSVWS